MYLCFQLKTCLVFSRYFIQCIWGGFLIIFASIDIIKTDFNLNGSHSNTWSVHPMDSSTDTDEWRNDV